MTLLSRLNGWHRIGVVASTLWIIFIALFAFREVSVLDPSQSGYLTDWVESDKPPILEGNYYLIEADRKLRLWKVFLAMVVPIILLWLGGFVVAWVVDVFIRQDDSR